MVLLTDSSNISFIEYSGQITKNRYNTKNQTFNSVYNEKDPILSFRKGSIILLVLY